MASFILAYKKTAINEGGYANDPDDRGGETWKGIARKFHPKWPGWKIVDGYKGRSNFKSLLARDEQLQKLVYEFYRTEFWNRISGDEINHQLVANSLYDSAVNMGVSQAIKLAQRALKVAETGKMSASLLNQLNNQA